MHEATATQSTSSLRGEVAKTTFRALNSLMVPAVRAGLGSPLPIGGGVVILETTGRRSGTVRQVPLVALRAGKTLKVSTVRGDSQWIANLEADPSAAIWLHGRRANATAQVERGPLNVATLALHD